MSLRSKRHRAAERFDVVAASARGAVVDLHAGEAFQQAVVVGEEAGDVLDFRDALAVGRVVAAPEDQRLDVEVVPVEIDLFAADDAGRVVDEPFQGVGIAEIVNHAVLQRHSLVDFCFMARRRLQQPLGMIRNVPILRAGIEMFRLEPGDELAPLRVNVIAHGLQSVGKADGIGIVQPVVNERAGVHLEPAEIDPPVIELQFLFLVAVDPLLLVRFGDAEIAVRVAVAEVHAGLGQFAVRMRRVVGEHPLPPEVLRTDAVAFVELHDDQRRADFFAGQQLEVRQFLARRDAQSIAGVAGEFRRPLARPADGDDHAARGRFDVEIRKLVAARTAAEGGDFLLLAGTEHDRIGPVHVAHAVADRAVQGELAGGAALERYVDRLDVGEDRRVLVARVLEIKRPFDGRKIAILDADAAQHQSGLRIGVGERAFRPIVVELPARPLQLPGFQQFRRGLAVVDERERRIFGRQLFAVAEPRREPISGEIEFRRRRLDRPAPRNRRQEDHGRR